MILVLAYHSISDRDYDHAVTPEMFEWQLSLLTKHFNVIPARKLVEMLREGQRIPKGNYAVVTFDDGFEDNYINAFPILKRLKIPATIFLITSFVGKFRKNPEGMDFSYLSWDQMLEMQESGLVKVESHAHTHRLLTTLSTSEMFAEVHSSKSLIEKCLGSHARLFAYPKGNFDDNVTKVVASSFIAAFGSTGPVLFQKNLNLFAIPRVIMSRNVNKLKYRMMMSSVCWHFKRKLQNVNKYL